ncbi:MAG: hypothetical protein Q4E46_00705 [Candidatus Saccharibacteria bacterium]|nr:hypothetical protein [Candidatus Saccharibacteria bacterium]
MYTIDKSNHLVPIDFPKNYSETYLPGDNVYTVLQLEDEAFRLFPTVRDCHRGVELNVTDVDDNPILPYDLALNLRHNDQTLRHAHEIIYARESAGQTTKLVYRVNTGPNRFRVAAIVTPIWVGDVAVGHLTWNIRSLHAEPEEIARLCCLLNKHELIKF